MEQLHDRVHPSTFSYTAPRPRAHDGLSRAAFRVFGEAPAFRREVHARRPASHENRMGSFARRAR